MNGWKPGKSPTESGKYLVKSGTDFGNKMQSEVTLRIRQLSKDLQKQLNTDIAGGPVAFTNRALFFNFIRNANGSRTNQIIIRGAQAAYLRTVINSSDANELYDKLIPTSNARLSKQGNISGLQKGLANKRLVVVEEKGKKYLIDTTKKSKKQHTKRVIGVKEKKKRKMVFDFFQNAEDGAKLILSDIKGTYKLTKRID